MGRNGNEEGVMKDNDDEEGDGGDEGDRNHSWKIREDLWKILKLWLMGHFRPNKFFVWPVGCFATAACPA